jgi:hypothetical protein
MDVYQLAIALRGISPMVWRRLKIAGNTDLGDLHTIIQTVHDVTDEVRELIHRLAQLQQCIGALVIDAFQPRCNRGRGDEEGVGRLFEGPASRGAKLEDCHALMAAVMRPPLRRDLRYAGALDARRFAQEGILFVR